MLLLKLENTAVTQFVVVEIHALCCFRVFLISQALLNLTLIVQNYAIRGFNLMQLWNLELLGSFRLLLEIYIAILCNLGQLVSIACDAIWKLTLFRLRWFRVLRSVTFLLLHRLCGVIRDLIDGFGYQLDNFADYGRFQLWLQLRRSLWGKVWRHEVRHDACHVHIRHRTSVYFVNRYLLAIFVVKTICHSLLFICTNSLFHYRVLLLLLQKPVLSP